MKEKTTKNSSFHVIPICYGDRVCCLSDRCNLKTHQFLKKALYQRNGGL